TEMKKNVFVLVVIGVIVSALTAFSSSAQAADKTLDEIKAEMRALYGENKPITDGNYDKSLAVKCINGTFVGKKRDGVIAYKGIPFVGKQPVGEFRWKAPVDFVPDDGVYEAYYNGKSPCQPYDRSQVASLYVSGEDCLYLNVWRADNGGTKKPVMVWIHGGAFEFGGTVEPREEGTNFVRENPDVILVSIEYRLGVFGFWHLSHLPDGKDYPDAQNLGLMDQMMALKWIHENIANFGGDPDNVTIWGESAGGDSVTTIPLIEGSHKYFRRVIAQSGTPVLSRTPEQAIDDTNKVMKMLGCKTVADLQKVDVEKLLLAVELLGDMHIGPEKDGKYLPLDPYEAYAKGAAKDIEFLQGCNKDESNYFMFIAEEAGYSFVEMQGKRWAENRNQLTDEEKALVDSYYNDIKGESYEPLCKLYNQIWFFAPLFRILENQAQAGGKSYAYYFTVESSVPLIKSGHAIEISTIFNRPEETYVSGRAFDETFSKTMRKMWVQFAKTGNPSLSAEISPDGKAHEWPLYDSKNKSIMVLDEFNIHPSKESELKLVDWDRCYFLTKYYCL
ncbi:MAG: carboxylesterase family protein, partial [Synergistaceae bacterium]|nr:carboxylesterase family protein [Synergistaceae bacterium]